MAVALSGGVDSAAAAAVLLRLGNDVLGLTMRLPTADAGGSSVEAAASVARSLGIAHEVIDLADEFERLVVSPFVESYSSALTPNPCVECNRSVKFGLLLEAALARGCDALATGHYARLEGGGPGRYRLFRGADRSKDQSYVLWTLGQDTLERVSFPLGNMHKKQAAGLALNAGADVGAQESQDICFLSGNSYRDLLAERAGGMLVPGPILDREGRVLGEHRGLAFYTVGQRRGLGLGGPRPMYVLELRREDNTLLVGDMESVRCSGFYVEGLSFVSGNIPTAALDCLVQTRYQGPALPALLEPAGEYRAIVRYPEPGPAAAPGQSAVFYSGDELLGGGLIIRGHV